MAPTRRGASDEMKAPTREGASSVKKAPKRKGAFGVKLAPMRRGASSVKKAPKQCALLFLSPPSIPQLCIRAHFSPLRSLKNKHDHPLHFVRGAMQGGLGLPLRELCVLH